MSNFQETQAVGVDELVGQAICDTEADCASDVVSELGSDEDDLAMLSGDWAEMGADGRPKGKKEEATCGAFSLLAGQTIQLQFLPQRAMKLSHLIAQFSNPDHRFVRIVSIDVGGKNEINGGNFPLDMANDWDNRFKLSGAKVVANQPINITLQNTDLVNVRTANIVVFGPSA